MKKFNVEKQNDNSSMKTEKKTSYLDKLILAQLEVTKQKVLSKSFSTK